MESSEFYILLRSLGACREASEWAAGKSLREVWQSCTRGDWLLWLCGKMADKPGWPTRQQVVLAACDCAEMALKYVPQGEDRPRDCIEVVRKWARGLATVKEVRKVRYAASAAAYVSYAASAAAASAAAASVSYAASAAAYVSYAASAAAASVSYAASAAAAADAAASVSYAARKEALANCADLVRDRITSFLEVL